MRAQLASLLAASALVLLSSPAHPRTWYITSDGSGDAPTIQAGIDSAAVGDTVLVATGSYDESLVMKSEISLIGENPNPACTIVDARGRGIYCLDLQPSTLIAGLTFAHGNIFYGEEWRERFGAGLCCELSELSIVRCHFIDNSATYDGGAGVALRESLAEISDCLFRNNFGHYYAGGAYAVDSHVRLVNCTFEDNRVNLFGAGVCCEWCDTVLDNCTFKNNTSQYQGGGVFSKNGSLSLTGCTFVQNSVVGPDPMYGGAVCCPSGLSEFTRCEFKGNRSGGGGGVSLYSESSVAFTDCVFTGNAADWQGGALHVSKWTPNLTLSGCLFSGNSANTYGGGLCYGGSATLTGSIFWSNCAPEAHEYYIGTEGNAFFECCDVDTSADGVAGSGAVVWGEGCFSANPRFCQPVACSGAPAAEGDYTLAADSPCLPENNSCGVLIGPYGRGCGPTALTPQTWARVKVRYK